MALPSRLLTPATLLFKAMNEAHVPAILFGGAAVRLNGAQRETRDLDINVGALKFWQRLPAETFYSRPSPSSSSRMRVTYMHPTDAISCDIVADHASLLPYLMKYTNTTTDGITYALPNLLVADKLRAYGQRGVQAEAKVVNDYLDILYLLQVMVNRGETMPVDLKQIIATDDVIRVGFGRNFQKRRSMY